MFQEHHIIELLERIERQNEHIAQQNERIELQNSQLQRKDDHIERLERDILKLDLDILRQLKRLQPPTITKHIAVKFTGDSTMADNALVLNVGQTSQASIQPFLADGTTPSGGTVSAVSFTFSDPSATVALNPDGLTATVTGVAASTGPVSGSASCTVTDTDGVVSTWNQAFTIQTSAVVPPAQLTQSIAVQFSTPTP